MENKTCRGQVIIELVVVTLFIGLIAFGTIRLVQVAQNQQDSNYATHSKNSFLWSTRGD